MKAGIAVQAQTKIQKLPLLDWDHIGEWVADAAHRDTSSVTEWSISDIEMSPGSYAVRFW